jgi:hypothetical protein
VVAGSTGGDRGSAMTVAMAELGTMGGRRASVSLAEYGGGRGVRRFR